MSKLEQLPLMVSPRVSVVVCNFNYEAFLASAIDSVLGQTYPAHELILVDDGSTDGSLAIMRAHEGRPGVQIIAKPNGGQISAYNAGFERATGDVVLFLDSDDLLKPEALAHVAKAFGAGVAKVHFRLELMGPQGDPLGATIPNELARGEVAHDFLKRGVPHLSPPASGNAYRRSVLQQIFPLPTDEQDRHGADFFCIYGSTLLGEVAACDEVLGLYRLQRDPRQEAPQAGTFTFGNAGRGKKLDQRQQARLDRFRVWMAARTNGRIQAPQRLLDFSVEKSAFAAAALAEPSGPWARGAGWAKVPLMLRAIWARRQNSLAKKLGLSAWVFVVLLAPYKQALQAARYVCDPGHRHQPVKAAA